MEHILGFLTEDDQRLLIEAGEIRLFEKDEIMLEEGDRRRIIHIILEGTCRVERSHFGKGVLIAGLEAGEFFGEMSFLEGVGASATVVANGAGKVLCVSPESVNSLLQSESSHQCRLLKENHYLKARLALQWSSPQYHKKKWILGHFEKDYLEKQK